MPLDDSLIDEGITECFECHGTALTKNYERGELVCDECGMVLEDRFIDHRPERTFDEEDIIAKTHIGDPETPRLHDRGLTTDISRKNRDAANNNLSAAGKRLAYRLRKWQRRLRIIKSNERTLVHLLSDLNHVTANENIAPVVKNTAAIYLRKSVNKLLIRGYVCENIVDAILYASLRKCNNPYTLSEIAALRIEKVIGSKEFRVHRKDISGTYRHLRDPLQFRLPPVDPSQYLQRFCGRLYFTNTVKIINQATEILNKYKDYKIFESRCAQGIAAAVIWISSVLCKDIRSQDEVANAAYTTSVTLRNRYQELTKYLTDIGERVRALL